MTYIPHRRPLSPLHEAPQVSAEALSRDFGRALKRENVWTVVWGFLGQMQIFELKHFENHYRSNLVDSRLSKRDVGSHDEASAPSSASSTCWPARMCAARSARVRRLAGGRTSWQNVAKLLQRLASFRLYPHRFLHAKRKHRRKYFMPSTKTAELTLANGL